jgi:DNA-binding phage protein
MVTGADRYFAERTAKNSDYRAALEEARSRIATMDSVMRALDERRKAFGLSKAELARRAGMRPEVVRRLLGAGPANPTLATVVSLATVLSLEVEVHDSATVSDKPSAAAETRRRTA